MTRVAPLSSVKSVSAYIVLHTVGGWGLGGGALLMSGGFRLGLAPSARKQIAPERLHRGAAVYGIRASHRIRAGGRLDSGSQHVAEARVLAHLFRNR
jgi:hypothetical protein